MRRNIEHGGIYLDYAATTPVDPAVLRAMKPYFSEKFGNPGSLHSFGQEAIAAVDRSRETIAKFIGAEFREIIFTGSATESNNLALRGAVKFATRHSPLATRASENSETRVAKPEWRSPRIIVSAIEHESILETARDLERDGAEIIYLPVNKSGVVDLKKLKENLNERTVLVSVMYVNNEIGTVQPISEISEIIRNFRATRSKGQAKSKNANSGRAVNSSMSHVPCPIPLFHVDASQAFQFFDCNVEKLGIDMMTLSAHKMYGLKGAGALYVSDKGQATSNKGGKIRVGNPTMSHVTCPMSPLLTGGGQEFGFRSGTESVPAIVGFAKAVGLSAYSRDSAEKKIGALREYFWREMEKIFPKAEINGISRVARPEWRMATAPHILNIYFPGHAAQDILTRLDLAGIAASSGSACRSRAMESSYVIEALGHSKERAKSSVRFSFGRPTTKGEIGVTVKALKKIFFG